MKNIIFRRFMGEKELKSIVSKYIENNNDTDSATKEMD